jgi:hypothetical protein
MSAVAEMLQFYPIQPDTEVYLPVCHLHPTVTQIPFIKARMKPGISLITIPIRVFSFSSSMFTFIHSVI